MRLWTILAALPLAACGSANGNDSGGPPATGAGTSRSFDVSGFTAVELAGSDDVDVRVGPAFSVRAEGPSDELDTLDIRRVGNALKVGRQARIGFKWNATRRVRVLVTMPAIAEARLAGSGNMLVDRVVGGDFAGSVAGSGTLGLGTLDVGAAELSIAGSGDITAAGRARAAKVSVSGSGDLDAPGLKLSGADVRVAGSGDVTVDVNGRANVTIVGSGEVDLGTRATCEVTIRGSGRLRCS